jgi:glycine/D-amino acid oxidase-like deaminating enzyme
MMTHSEATHFIEEGTASMQLARRRPDPAFDVIVIGGGQAGLSVGYHLARTGARFLILEAHARIGDAWRKRWDSLRLFTPREAQQPRRHAVPRAAKLLSHQG